MTANEDRRIASEHHEEIGRSPRVPKIPRVPRVVVIGSLNMDLVVEAERPPQMGETILGKQIHFIPGGKGANQAVAAARLGAHTTMIGAVGEDSFGQELVGALAGEGIAENTIKQVKGVATGVASILLAQGDNSIIVVSGANYQCLPEDIDQHEELIAQADIVLLQLEIPLETVIYAVKVAKQHGRKVILNPAPAQPLPDSLLKQVDYLTPNVSELALLAGTADGRGLEQEMDWLLGKGVGAVITTLGAEGVAYKTTGSEFKRCPAHQVEVVDTTGAGDSFNAALACSLAEGKQLDEALEFAGKVAALAVTRLGAQAGMPTRHEVENGFESRG